MDLNGPASFEVDAYTLNLDIGINDRLQLISVTGYREMIEDRMTDLDGAKGNFLTVERDNDYEQFSQEVRVEFMNEKLTAVTGLYYWRSEFTQDFIGGGEFRYAIFRPILSNPRSLVACQRGLIPGAVCDAGAPPNHPGWRGPEIAQPLYTEQLTKSIAVFAQVDYEITLDWTATVGLRWTEESKDFLGGQAYLAPVERAYERNFPDYADLSQTWRELSPKVGLSYRYSDDVLFYASYSEGFHSGGFFGVNLSVSDFERDQYDPEFANSWEGGMKGQFFDNRVQLNATYFYNDFKDKQEQAVQLDEATKAVTTVFSNVASAVYMGFELELRAVLNPYVNVFATYGNLDADYKDFVTDLNPNDDNLGQVVEDATHLQPRNAPENTYGFGGLASIPMGPGEIEMNARYNFVDSIETSLVNADNGRLRSRDFIHASVAYHWQNMSLTLFGRNLDNEVWEVYRPISRFFAFGTRVPGRNWGLELEVDL